MKFKHNEVYKSIANKFKLTFGKESMYPKNYTTFYKNSETENFMGIELIPLSKKYLKISYIMFDNRDENEYNYKQIYYSIIDEYKEQRKDIGIEMQRDNNMGWDSVMV